MNKTLEVHRQALQRAEKKLLLQPTNRNAQMVAGCRLALQKYIEIFLAKESHAEKNARTA